MTDYRAVIKLATGSLQNIQNGDDLVTGSGLKNGAGNLTITPAGGSVILAGNLVVNGTTTTINSTTVDIADRVVHFNHSTGANDPVPTQITGFSIHRGAVASVDRDHAGLFWDEGNSRWNFALNTGGDDATLGADQALKVGATTVTAGLTQSGGVVSLSANAASSFTTSAGALTITSAAAATWSTAAGALTLNGAGGTNLQNAGSTKVAIDGTGAVVQAGAILSTTGTGNINLPQNASARFQIEGVATTATVTAANLTTLTNGSNADALHVHAAAAATNVSVSATSGEALNTGEVVSFANAAGVPRVFQADADGTGQRQEGVGVTTTTAGAAGIAIQVRVSGEVSVPDTEWDVLPAVTDVGKRVYLSATPGNFTLTAPTASGTITLRIGWLSQGGTGACKVILGIGEGIFN